MTIRTSRGARPTFAMPVPGEAEALRLRAGVADHERGRHGRRRRGPRPAMKPAAPCSRPRCRCRRSPRRRGRRSSRGRRRTAWPGPWRGRACRRTGRRCRSRGRGRPRASQDCVAAAKAATHVPTKPIRSARSASGRGGRGRVAIGVAMPRTRSRVPARRASRSRGGPLPVLDAQDAALVLGERAEGLGQEAGHGLATDAPRLDEARRPGAGRGATTRAAGSARPAR